MEWYREVVDSMDETATRHFLRAGFLIAAIFPQFLFTAHAQTASELGAQQSEQFLREEQRRLKMIERERLLRELEKSLYPALPIPDETPALDTASDTCFEITEIELIGADNLYHSEKLNLTEAYLGLCLSLNDIDRLRVDIDRFYIEKGWIMARAYLLPNQNIKSGVLKFKILEGLLDSIELNDNNASDKRQIDTAFPDMLEQIIFMRDIEQGLDQINRLASNRATMSIEPARDRPGYSRILVSNETSNPYQFVFGLDDQGSDATGRERGRFSANMDNLLSLNDNWYFSATDYIGGDGQDKSSSSYSLNLTLPYGYWSYGLSASHSDYGSTVEAASGPFQTSGDADSQALKVSRIISRGKTSKTTLSLNLTAKQNNSLLEDVRLASSSRKLTLFDVGINHALRGSGSTWSLTLNYSRGLDLFDALVDGPDSGNDIPKAQFEKLAWDISVQLPLAAGEGDWSYQGTWSGQLSADPLFGSEQLAIGDLGSVRGFRDSPLSGDSGLYFKNDLNWRPGFSLAWLKNMTLTLGLDLGYISAKNDNIQGSGEGQASLAGLALGLQQSLGLGGQQSLNWSLLLGTPLSAPAFIVQENFVVYFDLSWSMR